jgi:hypothetical protein
MQFSFDIASGNPPEKIDPVTLGSDVSFGPLVFGVLQQMLENQRQSFQEMTSLLREQLNHSRAMQQEQLSRWKSMEKTYIDMLNQMATDLAERGDDAFESEFALQEFIDRNAVKVGQFAHLLSILGPISEVGNQIAAQKEQR